MLFTRARVVPGATILVQGATGGVATALTVLASAAGVRVWVTGRSEEKRARALELGAEQAFEPGAPPADRSRRRLPGAQPGTGAGNGGGEGGGSATGGGLDSSGLDPVISGPAKARTVRVDSKGRFRVAGVGVACPAANPSACSVSVRVTTANGSTLRFVKRTFTVQPGAVLSLKKLKVSKKALKALRSMKVARVVSAISASRPGGAKTSRAIGLKLKPAKR